MPTQWTARFILFIQANKLNTANLMAAQWDPDTGGAQTFGELALSPSGQPPATHYATNTPATPTMRDGITTALGVIPWAELYYTEDVTAGDRATWTGPLGWTHTGTPVTAWLAALAHMGLTPIQSEEP